MFAWPLPEAPTLPSVGNDSVSAEELDHVARARGVQREWFFSDPPGLSNRGAPPDDWITLYKSLEHPRALPDAQRMVPSDAFKAWNTAFLGDPCLHPVLRQAPGHLFVYDQPDGSRFPMFRFLPDVTLPDGLVTNQIGWRGRPIEVPRGDRTVRIVFVGASTVVDAHDYPFSHSDFVGHWLNLWAESQDLNVRFEVLNAARESVKSTDIAAIVHDEVLSVRPDLVLYYEGGNQFDLTSMVDDLPPRTVRPTQRKAAPLLLQQASRYSALMGRVEAAVSLVGRDWESREWPKPTYHLTWPPGLDEFDPDLSYPRLPVNLNTVQHDLERIRTDLSSVGAELAVSSFFWLVKDGMKLDPVKGRYALQQLNVGYYPFRYRDLERLAAFQNRVFAKYAASHGLTFVDLAHDMPFDPDLFTDAVHFSYGGTQLRAWIILQHLIPVVEKHLSEGTWPRPMPPDAAPLPRFTPRKITFDCTETRAGRGPD